MAFFREKIQKMLKKYQKNCHYYLYLEIWIQLEIMVKV